MVEEQLRKPTVFRRIDFSENFRPPVSIQSQIEIPVALASLAIVKGLGCDDAKRQTIEGITPDGNIHFGEHFRYGTPGEKGALDLYIVGKNKPSQDREFLIYAGDGNGIDRSGITEERFNEEVAKILSNKPFSEKLTNYARDLALEYAKFLPKDKRTYLGIAAVAGVLAVIGARLLRSKKVVNGRISENGDNSKSS